MSRRMLRAADEVMRLALYGVDAATTPIALTLPFMTSHTGWLSVVVMVTEVTGEDGYERP